MLSQPPRFRRRPRETGRVLLGMCLALALHALQAPIGLVVQPALAYVGITEWLYLIPAVMLAGRLRQPALRRGLLIGGIVTFLVNAIAYGVMYYVFFVPH